MFSRKALLSLQEENRCLKQELKEQREAQQQQQQDEEELDVTIEGEEEEEEEAEEEISELWDTWEEELLLQPEVQVSGGGDVLLTVRGRHRA